MLTAVVDPVYLGGVKPSNVTLRDRLRAVLDSGYLSRPGVGRRVGEFQTMPRSFADRPDELESGEREIVAAPEASLVLAYLRHPGRWQKATFIAAARIAGIFDGLTPHQCEDVLDRIECVVESVEGGHTTK